VNTQTSNQLTVGINTDIHPKFQQEGSYRFALNAVLETREGDQGTISNELGNTVCATLPYFTKIIGHAATENEEIVLALFHKAAVNPVHEIGLYNPLTCSYTSIARSSKFNFSDQHQVNMFVRIRNGCERVLHMTDNYNPYRVANITNTQEWVTPITLDVPDITKIKFSRDYTHPSYELTVDANNKLVSSNSGGVVKLGTYNITTRLLDAEGNATNWMEISRPIAISDNNFSLLDDISTYNHYDGGSNEPTDVGYISATNKSITVTLTNLDTRFKYFQVAVIKRTSTDGSITGVDVLNKQQIETATTNFTYTGFDSQIEYQTSIDEILAENVILNKVATHTTLDGRLYVGNIQNTLIDYTGFQRHATRTKVEYVKVNAANLAEKAKQPNYYFSDASFLADEVYALGVVYVFKDGSVSPVFHIPGRAPDVNIVGTNPYITGATNWDTDNLPSDINVYNISKTKRWQIYNTATKYTFPSAGVDVSGLMGYYEVDTVYPEVDNPCDTDPEGYWGSDIEGNLIEAGVTKIRHHRMPSHDLVNSSIVTDEYKTGIEFTMNTNYPHADIVGHFYTHSDRTYEKTILDKGLVTALKSDTNLAVQQAYAGFLTNKSGSGDCASNVLRRVASHFSTYAFISPKTTLEDTYSIGTYLRLEKYLSGSEVSATLTPTSERFDKIIHIQDTFSAYSQSYTTSAQFNYKIEWSSFLKKSAADSPANSVNVPAESLPVANISVHNNFLLISTENKLQPFQSATLAAWNYDKFATVSLKADVDVYSNLFQINYRRIGNTIHQKNPSVAHTNITFAGDVFTTRFTAVDYVYARNTPGDVFVTGDVVTVPIESELAYEFRHGDDNTLGENTYYKFNPNDPSPIIPLGEYIADKYYEPIPDESSYFYPEKYLLNKSYSNLDSINRYFPLPFDYEYCNDCLQIFPYRIYYSELDDAESSKDNFRIIRPLNYQDLSGTTGNLNDLFVNFSKLYALTDISPYYVPTRPQQLTTQENSVYIGTSEVFGVPPQQLKITDYHFGGSRLFKSRCVTEYGAFYIDDFNGRPFLITNELNDLSLKGLRNFWQENGKLEFDKQFYQKTGTHYPNISTSSSTGVGYITTYDPRFKRIIVHKKDYKLLPNYTLIYQTTNPGVESIWYNGRFFFYVNSSGTATLITFDDTTYFECKSFTLSYSFLTQSWVSFHSYLPYYLFNNYLSFYSGTLKDEYIYIHNEGEHTNYYGNYAPHIIDLIAVNNPNEEVQYNNVIYSSTSQVYDFDTKQYKNLPITFNGAIFYNSKQSTGLRTLKLKESEFEFDYDAVTSLVDKVDNKYKISNLRDVVIDEDSPIWDSSWNAIQSSPFNYIDKFPNIVNLDYFASEFTKPRLKDYYLGMRLMLAPTQDVKINTDIINTRNTNRTR